MRTLFLILLLFAVLSLVPKVDSAVAPKAEDDFTLVKVADGVYAAVAKSGGLASGKPKIGNWKSEIGNDLTNRRQDQC